MSDGDLLLRRVLDRPDDITARLIYADWLDEQDDERSAARAKLIRNTRRECGGATGPDLDPNTYSGPLPVTRRPAGGVPRASIAVLDLLLGEPYLNPYLWYPSSRVCIRYGFVESADLPEVAWLRIAAPLLAGHPVGIVRVYGVDGPARQEGLAYVLEFQRVPTTRRGLPVLKWWVMCWCGTNCPVKGGNLTIDLADKPSFAKQVKRTFGHLSAAFHEQVQGPGPPETWTLLEERDHA